MTCPGHTWLVSDTARVQVRCKLIMQPASSSQHVTRETGRGGDAVPASRQQGQDTSSVHRSILNAEPGS